jgi:hypothetical protein
MPLPPAATGSVPPIWRCRMWVMSLLGARHSSAAHAVWMKEKMRHWSGALPAKT